MPIEMVCQGCKQPFYCYPSDVKAGRKYCRIGCKSESKGPIAARHTPVNFTCNECHKPFFMMQSYLAAYQKKFGRDPLYCSIPCSNEGRRKVADERNRFVCSFCKKLSYKKRRAKAGTLYREQQYCDSKCKADAQRARALKKFESGNISRHTKRHGYVWISVPSLVTGKKHAMLEHRYNMERKLGRKLLPEETVHHINGVRADNGPENLELFSSRHGPGQRVIDKVDFAIEILRLYPEFARQRGVELRELEPPINGAAGETHSMLSLPS